MHDTRPSVYLCGPIRNREDYNWRLDFAKKYEKKFRSLIPSDIGVSDATKLNQFKPSSYMTYRTDLHLVDISDIVVANLLALDTGYRGTGSLIEIGYAIKGGKLILAVVSEEVRKHPFLQFGLDGVFGSMEELDGYIEEYLAVLSGSQKSLEAVLNKNIKES